jgi:hypothetical protein
MKEVHLFTCCHIKTQELPLLASIHVCNHGNRDQITFGNPWLAACIVKRVEFFCSFHALNSTQ